MLINTQEKTKQNYTVLSATQKQNYQQDGYLVLPNFFNDDSCEMLINHTRLLVEYWDDSDVKTIFSTTKQSHEKEIYFLDSGDKIRFFFEAGALNEDGSLKKNKLYSLNKIGHALHDLDPIFYCFSRQHKIAALCKDLNIIDPLLIQSMYIYKQPYIGGEVNAHQDSTFLFVKDQPVTGFWIALQDATINNGCLWAIPGGHQTPLKKRLLRSKENHITYEVYDDTPWPLEKMQPIEVPRGSLVVLHGLLPHMSKENLSPISRHAYTLHVMAKHSEYAKDNWLQRSPDHPFRGFLG